jgi:hypothetical protein
MYALHSQLQQNNTSATPAITDTTKSTIPIGNLSMNGLLFSNSEDMIMMLVVQSFYL